jgi:hypothetical protein
MDGNFDRIFINIFIIAYELLVRYDIVFCILYFINLFVYLFYVEG